MLLILAVVAINSVNKTGIIDYAHNAVDAYEKGQNDEEALIQGYMDYLNEYGNIGGSNEPVSIVGIYGNNDKGTNQYRYYEFKEDGTVEYVYYDSSPSEERKEVLTYTIDDNGNGMFNHANWTKIGVHKSTHQNT